MKVETYKRKKGKTVKGVDCVMSLLLPLSLSLSVRILLSLHFVILLLSELPIVLPLIPQFYIGYYSSLVHTLGVDFSVIINKTVTCIFHYCVPLHVPIPILEC